MEEATFLTKFASEVTIIHRREELRASKIMQNRAKENEKISWELNAEVEEVVAGENGMVSAVKVRNKETGETEGMNTDGVFVAIGHEPNTGFLKGHLDMDDKGYLDVKEGSTHSSVDGVFARGTFKTSPTSKLSRRPAQAVWLQWTPSVSWKERHLQTGASVHRPWQANKYLLEEES